MTTVRIALASIPLTRTIDQALAAIAPAIEQAAEAGSSIVCFPEAVLPGHRMQRSEPPAYDQAGLEQAVSLVRLGAMAHHVAVVLGTECVVQAGRQLTSVVIDADGVIVGEQRKTQIAPDEDSLYVHASGRSIFQIGELRFGIAICHEAFRYPETVRWAALHGAELVFAPNYAGDDDTVGAATTWCNASNAYYERAITCRAIENTIYVATCNVAISNQECATAVVDPDGALVAMQPYGEAGVLIVDLDLTQATGLIAHRFAPERTTTAAMRE